MHALPDELCQDVFARLSGFEQRFDFVHPTQALSAFNEAVCTPFRIAATCARWRALVLNSPELWAFAHARDDRPADDAYLRMCMERSGQHPLDIWIHTSVKYSSSDSDDNADGEGELIPHGIIFGWLDLLRKNAHRWRRIRIDLPGSTPIDKFSPFMEPMPLLEQLVLSTPSTWRNEHRVDNIWKLNPRTQQLYFHSCPNLRSLATHAVAMIPDATLSKLEYLNFSLRGVSDDAPLWAALAMTPFLKELNIYYQRCRGYPSKPPQTPQHLPALRNLGLIGYFQYGQDLGRFLTIPNLEKLTVSVEPADRLAATFTSIGRTVKHIVVTAVDNIGWFSHSDAEALDTLQLVETLELCDIQPNPIIGDTEDFFASLAGIGDYSDNPMPRWGRTLRRLILRDCAVNLEKCNSLATLVNMREMAVRDHAGDAFELQLINTKFMKRMDNSTSKSLASVMHLFGPFIVEEHL